MAGSPAWPPPGRCSGGASSLTWSNAPRPGHIRARDVLAGQLGPGAGRARAAGRIARPRLRDHPAAVPRSRQPRASAPLEITLARPTESQPARRMEAGHSARQVLSTQPCGLANTARSKTSIPSAHILHLARQRGRLGSGQVIVVVANFSDFSTPPGPSPGIRGAQLAGVSLRAGDGGRSASSATSHRNGSAENHLRPGNEDLHAGKSGSRPATASRRLSPSARRLDRTVRATRGGKP